MSATVKERTTHTSRKIMSHGGGGSISSQPTTTVNSLENNLDALLEDLQTSVSRSATPNRGGRTLSPEVEYRVAANPTKVVSESRSISPTQTMMTSTEKYVSTGQSGSLSGIPGLEFVDAELQNVQPGQSKTIAYKQVSYQYNKSHDAQPLESWTTDNALTNTSTAMIDDVRERTYEESTLHSDSVNKLVNRELVYNDNSLPRMKQVSPSPAAQQRDVIYIHESSKPAVQNTVTTEQTRTTQEYGNVEYVPVPSPTPAIPINLAPGPNTKVTTTVKTYTYELPGPPQAYLAGGAVPGTVVLPRDQTVTYTIPKGSSSNTDKLITYQTVTENVPSPPGTRTRYSTPTPVIDSAKKTTTIHHEEHIATLPGQPKTIIYRPSSPPVETKTTTVMRNEKYYQIDGTYPNGLGDRVDRPGTTVIYQNQPPVVNETRTAINQIEEHYPNRPAPGGRHPTPDKLGTPVNYYTSSPPQSTTTVYKFSNTTSTIPPNKNPDEHEVLLPKPFPTDDVQSGKPRSPNAVQSPPKKLEELMASFSDTEREVLEDIKKRETEQHKESPGIKKEVDFVPHTPPKVQSKNVAGPPVYYPPGAAEFTRKEEASAAMSQSGGWQKANAKYEYEASSKSKSKSSSGKAVVPVCLPLCCALPCVIM